MGNQISNFIHLSCLLIYTFFLNGLGFAAEAMLAWDANKEPVSGYKLYYGNASRNYHKSIDVGKVTQYTITGIEEGKNIYFAVTAYDAWKNESEFSTELECFTIVSKQNPNGIINPSKTIVVSHGTNKNFTITPVPNYIINDVQINGTSVGPVSSYTFSNIIGGHTISAVFEVTSHTITTSSGANGSIHPSKRITVKHGGNQTYTITANTGYKIQDVKVDEVSVGPVTSYTFSNVTKPKVISATFEATHHVITASAGMNGSISPLGKVLVPRGESQTFVITANAGYRIRYVRVNGVLIEPVTSYTFLEVTKAHTISAVFVASKR